MDPSVIATGTLPETSGLDRQDEVILGGLPLHCGALRQGGVFALTTGGKTFELDGVPAAWWPDGSIKWLRLCGAVDLKGGTENPFTLAPVVDTSTPDALTVALLPGIVEVTTPDLIVRLRPDAHRVLQVRNRDGRLLTRGPGLSATLRPMHPEGAPRERLQWTFEPPGLRVVEQSAGRVVLRLAGRFVEDGRVLAELITFVEIVKDAPRIGLQPVLIYLGDPDRDAIASLDFAVHTALGCDGGRFGFGQDDGPGYWDATQWLPNAHDWPQARLVQTGSTFFRLDKRTGPTAAWLKIREGRRAQGWCHLGDATGGVTGAMRYLWQEYPRALSIDADAGTLTFGLVPAAGEGLDLRRYAPELLGATLYETGEGAFPAQTHGATGIAKSNELMVHFHAAGASETEARHVGRSWTSPVRLFPNPDEFATSGVAGCLTAQAPAACAADEAYLVRLVEYLFAERETRGWYGLMDFGELMQSFISNRDQWAFDDGGYGWVNSESLPDLGLWLMALRHGRADWLEGAIAMTRHNRDVDMYHRGNFKGVGSRHNVNHWGCRDKEWRVSMPLVKRFHDYLTGDPWTREVILDTVAVYQSYERSSRTAPSMVSALGGLMVKAEMTGLDADREVLLKAMAVFAAAVRPDGHFANSLHLNLATGEGEPVAPTHATDGESEADTLMGSYFFLQSFGGQHILVELAETYQHADLIEALVRHADLYLQTFDMNRWKGHQVPNRDSALPFLALAYRHSGAERFKTAIIEALTEGWKGPTLAESGGDGPDDWPPHAVLADQLRRNKITCGIGNILHSRPYGYGVV